MRPKYFTYLNSFVTVLLIWIGHHKIFDTVWKANQWIILLNGLLLFFVVLFPFPTKTVGNFIGTEAVNTAVTFYAGFTGVIVLCMLFINIGIVNSPSLIINVEKNLPWFKNQIKQQLLAILVYAIVAFYSPIIALTVTFLIWVY